MADRTKVLIMGAAGRDFHNFNTYFREQQRVRDRRLHGHADPVHQRPQVPGRARRPVLPGRHPDPRRVRDARAGQEVRRRAGRLRLLGRAVRVRHAPLGARQLPGRRLHAHGPGQGHGQEHQAGDRRLRRAHRRRQEPDHAQDPDHAARGRQEGRQHPSPHALRRPRRPARAALRDPRRPQEVRVHHRGDGGVRAARRGRQRDLRRRRLRGHRARGREGSRRHPLGRRQQRLLLLRRRPVHHRRRPAPSPATASSTTPARSTCGSPTPSSSTRSTRPTAPASRPSSRPCAR